MLFGETVERQLQIRGLSLWKMEELFEAKQGSKVGEEKEIEEVVKWGLESKNKGDNFEDWKGVLGWTREKQEIVAITLHSLQFCFFIETDKKSPDSEERSSLHKCK